MSHDHLEQFFFSCAYFPGLQQQSKARLFIAAYKRLLIRHETEGVGGNCAALDDTGIPFITRDVIRSRAHTLADVDILDVSLAGRYDIVPSESCNEATLTLVSINMPRNVTSQLCRNLK